MDSIASCLGSRISRQSLYRTASVCKSFHWSCTSFLRGVPSSICVWHRYEHALSSVPLAYRISGILYIAHPGTDPEGAIWGIDCHDNGGFGRRPNDWENDMNTSGRLVCYCQYICSYSRIFEDFWCCFCGTQDSKTRIFGKCWGAVDRIGFVYAVLQVVIVRL